MQVHEIESDTTLQISMDVRDGHSLPDVGDLQITESGFVLVLDSLVDLLILFDTTEEVLLRLFSGHVGIVGIAGRDLERDVGCDDGGICAYRLEEDYVQIWLLCHPV